MEAEGQVCGLRFVATLQFLCVQSFEKSQFFQSKSRDRISIMIVSSAVKTIFRGGASRPLLTLKLKRGSDFLPKFEPLRGGKAFMSSIERSGGVYHPKWEGG